jgi:hypothetical protein
MSPLVLRIVCTVGKWKSNQGHGNSCASLRLQLPSPSYNEEGEFGGSSLARQAGLILDSPSDLLVINS